MSKVSKVMQTPGTQGGEVGNVWTPSHMPGTISLCNPISVEAKAK